MEHRDARPLGALLLLVAVLLSVLPGCTRARYRRAADDQVYALIGHGVCDPRWKLEDYSITPKPGSRMYDPDNPDRPPMPPDDPTSHELMECVDGKKGWPHWGRNGYTPYVENPCWLKYLARDANGVVVVDRQTAMQLALLNSREYQRELENLYFSALDVTFQRFRFDVQFFGANSTFFTADGPDRSVLGGSSSSLLEENNSLRLEKLSATGGEYLTGVANSLVWQFAGPDQYAATTLLDFSLFQPLLRAGGRAVVLENLTQSERALLANIRQMERFRHGFYTQIIAGRNPGIGPVRGGPGIESLSPSIPGGIGGILALMETQVRLRNQRANVAGLRGSLDQFEAFYNAGRIDNFQVDQARQALYNTQSQLMSLQTSYQNSLDSYKITLGLPPELPLQIEDPLLARFDLIDPKTNSAQEAVSDLLAKLRDRQTPITPADCATMMQLILEQSRTVFDVVENDMQKLDRLIPSRRAFLQLLSTRKELVDGDVDPSVANAAGFDQRLQLIHEDYVKQRDTLQFTLGEFQKAMDAAQNAPEGIPEENENESGPAAAGKSRRKYLLELATRLGRELSEFALTQARCRVEGITLVPVELDSSESLAIARENRLDWMNARAALVDTWRQVEVSANALRGDLSVVFSGDISTLGNNPVQFRSTTGQMRVGLQFDPPLTRLAERNLYREALINYQQARRQYYAYEDRVSQSLRNTLRTIERYQLDFELRRAGIHVAISQVDVMQLRLQKPPKLGDPNIFGATTARDLVQALTGLLSSQNEFLDAWVDYEAQRMNLDFDLGTMRLDAQGNWIDPGPIEPTKTAAGKDQPDELPQAPMPEEIAPPEPIPLKME